MSKTLFSHAELYDWMERSLSTMALTTGSSVLQHAKNPRCFLSLSMANSFEKITWVAELEAVCVLTTNSYARAFYTCARSTRGTDRFTGSHQEGAMDSAATTRLR